MEKPVRKVRWSRALLLSIFLGTLGVDRFYLGQPILGMLKFLTLGGFGFWWAYDIYLIATQKVKGVKFEEPKEVKEVDTYVPRNAASAKRLREMKAMAKESGIADYSEIINWQDEQLDKMEEAVKRKDKSAFAKLYQWYLDSLKVADFSAGYRARANKIGDKADKTWDEHGKPRKRG